MGNDTTKRVYTDQTGRNVIVPLSVDRIVSLVPSQTELLYNLGLESKISGQTLFCVHPREKFQKAVKVGGTKKLNIEKIIDINPDLIIANKEENDKNQIRELAGLFPVWVSDIHTLDDALWMIQTVGTMTQTRELADKLCQAVSSSFESLKDLLISPKPSVLYLIWEEPAMVAGKNTFINEMLRYSGFRNCIDAEGSRYPFLEELEIQGLNPDFIFLSSEPFPFKEKHLQKYQRKFPQSRVMLVDGEMFSWYGSRLLKSAEYFTELITSLKIMS